MFPCCDAIYSNALLSTSGSVHFKGKSKEIKGGTGFVRPEILCVRDRPTSPTSYEF